MKNIEITQNDSTAGSGIRVKMLVSNAFQLCRNNSQSSLAPDHASPVRILVSDGRPYDTAQPARQDVDATSSSHAVGNFTDRGLSRTPTYGVMNPVITQPVGFFSKTMSKRKPRKPRRKPSPSPDLVGEQMKITIDVRKFTTKKTVLTLGAVYGFLQCINGILQIAEHLTGH
jgi:hypothetical protein